MNNCIRQGTWFKKKSMGHLDPGQKVISGRISRRWSAQVHRVTCTEDGSTLRYVWYLSCHDFVPLGLARKLNLVLRFRGLPFGTEVLSPGWLVFPSGGQTKSAYFYSVSGLGCPKLGAMPFPVQYVFETDKKTQRSLPLLHNLTLEKLAGTTVFVWYAWCLSGEPS